MNDDIFPVTPRITDPDLRPSQYGADRQYGHDSIHNSTTSSHQGRHNDSSLIEFEQQDQSQSPHMRQQRGTSTHPKDDISGKNQGGFNVFGFNLTYKHIIIIVLVVIALLIVIYLVVNWLRKPGPGENLQQAPPQTGPPHGVRGQQGQQPQQPLRAPGGVGAQRAHPDASKSASELAALLQQSQNKLNELNGTGAKTNDDNTAESENNNDEEPETPAEETEAAPINITPSHTHMEIPQEQIDNILSTGDDEE
jgi:hypothetical protein